jgi:hypothetical protein
VIRVRWRTASRFITAARGGGSRIIKKKREEKRRKIEERKGAVWKWLEVVQREPGVGAISSHNGYFACSHDLAVMHAFIY